jgi:hypothetical protein
VPICETSLLALPEEPLASATSTRKTNIPTVPARYSVQLLPTSYFGCRIATGQAGDVN